MCKLRTDAFHQSAAQVFLDSIHGGGHYLFPGFAGKLLSVSLVHLPVAIAQQYRSHWNIQQVSHQGNQVGISLHLDFHHGISVLLILVGNPFYHAAYLDHTFFKILSFDDVIDNDSCYSHSECSGDVAE